MGIDFVRWGGEMGQRGKRWRGRGTQREGSAASHPRPDRGPKPPPCGVRDEAPTNGSTAQGKPPAVLNVSAMQSRTEIVGM